MREGDLLILRGEEIAATLAGREADVIDAVRLAYEAHGAGESALPHSAFLRFSEAANRIIALPAYLGSRFQMADVKWIASFPGNRARDLDRASAVVVLNSLETGRPWAVLEGSIISAKRTAASAALAARHLHVEDDPSVVGLIGVGPINFEVVRFLLAVFPRPGWRRFSGQGAGSGELPAEGPEGARCPRTRGRGAHARDRSRTAGQRSAAATSPGVPAPPFSVAGWQTDHDSRAGIPARHERHA